MLSGSYSWRANRSWTTTRPIIADRLDKKTSKAKLCLAVLTCHVLATLNMLDEALALRTSSSSGNLVKVWAYCHDPTLFKYKVLVSIEITTKVSAFSWGTWWLPFFQTVPAELFVITWSRTDQAFDPDQTFLFFVDGCSTLRAILNVIKSLRNKHWHSIIEVLRFLFCEQAH